MPPSAHRTPQVVAAPNSLLIKKTIETRILEGQRQKKRKDRGGGDGEKENQAIEEAPESTKTNQPASYQSYGRTTARLINFLAVVHYTVETGLHFELGDVEIDMDGDTPDNPKELKTFHVIEDWQIISNKIPGFCEEMVEVAADRVLRNDVCRHLSKGIESVRSDDCAALKTKVINFLMLNHHEPLVPPILPTGPGSKLDRGWHHPVTASLLCPIDWSATPATYTEILNGERLVTAEHLPRFLYPNDHDFDPDDMSKDVLRGYMMVRTAKFIFIGPSCATLNAGESQGRRGNAALAGIESMTPRTIAYVAVQLHFALSSAIKWSVKIGAFDYEHFYWNVVALFEVDREEGQEIINYYNHELFGDSAKGQLCAEHNDLTAATPMGFARALQQCAAKRSREDIAG